MPACLFCRIVAKEIPATVVFEDDTVLAFQDISPQAPVHLLLIPKAHCDGLNDLRPELLPVIGHLVDVAARIAAELGVAQGGYRLLCNCGADGGQTVPHLHVHLLAGKPLGERFCAP